MCESKNCGINILASLQANGIPQNSPICCGMNEFFYFFKEIWALYIWDIKYSHYFTFDLYIYKRLCCTPNIIPYGPKTVNNVFFKNI